MTKHHETIRHYPGTLEELANELGNLRYDALALFLQSLHRKLADDAAADQNRGRGRLAAMLRASAEYTSHAASAIENAWIISAPYMAHADDATTED